MHADSFAIENDLVRYVIGTDGHNLGFIDTQTEVNYCRKVPLKSFCRIKRAGKEYEAATASYTADKIKVVFGESGVNAVIRTKTEKHYIVFEVLEISDANIDEFVFLDLPLTLKGNKDEEFAGCALALNLKTNVRELPSAGSQLRALCYPRFGLVGAKAAVIGCLQSGLREIMKEVVSHAEELPKSPLGGPWAMEAPINRGSYLFNYGDLTNENADEWIKLLQSLGFTQLDYNTCKSIRRGDFQPNLMIYPNGYASLKQAIDKLHQAGLAVGLHTYAFFLSKESRFVSPIPHPQLAKDAAFTLSRELTSEDPVVQVAEPINMSTHTGFFARNSVSIQIDDELIVYSGISDKAPYGFTECQRGACGTRADSHKPGAKVYHLKECFGLFAPDGDSDLLVEVAACTAEAFNKCGFDMMYLDALDGEDILGGEENGWHYGSKFVFEICKRLERPALMEMSTFHHHLWFVRSRFCAWDHMVRGYKRFIDLHCKANEVNQSIFMPGFLGWWSIETRNGPEVEATFPDVMEYLCCKSLATDCGFSLEHGIDIDKIKTLPFVTRTAEIVKRYETLRLANYFSESVKVKLRVPGDEFTLVPDKPGAWKFRRIQYERHTVERADGVSNTWITQNKFHRQPVKLRIETLMSAGPFNTPDNITIIEPGAQNFHDKASAPGVSADLQISSEQVKVGKASFKFTAINTLSHAQDAGAMIGAVFSPPLNINNQQGLGVWIYGDGQGEYLNFQVITPSHGTNALGNHYVLIDFTGWRYLELIEPEGDLNYKYRCTLGQGEIWTMPDETGRLDTPHICAARLPVDYSQLKSFRLWYNNLPPNKSVHCYISAIKALPIFKETCVNPKITIGNKTITFPAKIESGCYLEFVSMSDCKLYDPKGKLICNVNPQGEAAILEQGANSMNFNCEGIKDANARAYVTTISDGEFI